MEDIILVRDTYRWRAGVVWSV